ncbi:hypothetical protein BG004_007871 [Podila humilis]|nr:hypothetical protein BG004_007871 [Podila humilis]
MTTPQEIFKAFAAIPTYSAATILPNSTDNTLNIQVSLSQRDLERNVRRKFTRSLVASVNADHSISSLFNGPSIDTGDAVAQQISPSGKMTAVLRSVAGDKKKHFVEIWSDGSILQLLETTAIHQDFYADSTFGTLEFSRDETKLVYVAERLKSEDAYEKFVYTPDWGETFTGKRDPALVVLDLTTWEVKVLGRFKGNLSPGQAIFSHDSESIIFTGYHRDPQFFGIVFCQNRLTGLYSVNVDGNDFKTLSGDLKSARSPRLSPDGTTLLFLSNAVNGPHASCAKLCKVDLLASGGKEGGVVSTVVDFVHKPSSDDHGFYFPGLYIDQLPRDLWVTPTKIVTSSAWRSRRTLLAIDIASGKVEDLTPISEYPGTTTALFANSRFILSTYSTPTEPWSLWLGQINAKTTADKLEVHFSVLEENAKKIEKPKKFYQPHGWSYIRNIPGQLESLETIFLEPAKEHQNKSAVSGSKPPLVIFPHGGPHSGFAAEFTVLNLVLANLGFAVALVNFTGSLGFGQDSVEALVGRVGELDVNECKAVRDHIIASGVVDAERVCMTGGSHGGFIVGHLLADPTFKACVMRNPVTDIPALTATSDIGEWGYAVNGLDFDMASPPTQTLSDPEVFRKLRISSPMEHVEKVTAPTLLLLGAGDRRVPPQQGISWWQARQNQIKKEGKEGTREGVNRIQVFEGTGHALDSVEAESNSLYSLASFLVEFTKVDPKTEEEEEGTRQEGAGRQGEGGRGAYI